MKLYNVNQARVLRVIDEHTVVIDRGTNHGLSNGQRFLIYRPEEDPILDPDTNEPLGYLEHVIGTAIVIHAQESISTLESDSRERSKRTLRRNPKLSALLGSTEETYFHEGELTPLKDPRIGDLARPI